MGDAHNLSLATYEYLAENGTFPATAPPVTVPPDLAEILSEEFPFTYKGVTYQWFSVTYPDRNNVWNTRNLGVLVLDYSTRGDMSEAMAAHAGADGYWSETHFYFVYRG